MEDLIHNFGINGYLLTAQIINFLIVLWILKRFAYKPILKLLERRKQNIIETQKNTEKAEKALQRAIEKEKEILRIAQNESKIILDDTKKEAEEIIIRTTGKANIQSQKILAEARSQIEKERKNIERELATNITELAIDMLKKALKDIVDEKDQAKMIEKATRYLKK